VAYQVLVSITVPETPSLSGRHRSFGEFIARNS
jgi:hypothetical protein